MSTVISPIQLTFHLLYHRHVGLSKFGRRLGSECSGPTRSGSGPANGGSIVGMVESDWNILGWSAISAFADFGPSLFDAAPSPRGGEIAGLDCLLDSCREWSHFGRGRRLDWIRFVSRFSLDYHGMDWNHGDLFEMDGIGTTVGWDHVEYFVVKSGSTNGRFDALPQSRTTGGPQDEIMQRS